MTTTTLSPPALTFWAANDVKREYALDLRVLVADYLSSNSADNADFCFGFIYYISRYGSFGKLTDEQWRTIEVLHKELKTAYAEFCEYTTNAMEFATEFYTKNYSVIEIQAAMLFAKIETYPISNDSLFLFVAARRALQNTFNTKCITQNGKIA